ncbi:decarboxylating NADP(+)-dependent phosphogluconate dehydrogenase [Aquimarina sp. ERC-38]|uniref:decarboxylating NADP(+)-dependent phosphogluconate dehydrogenase n=1 Tax=Aquimarina sp. ERC-38 TaxID=2949996 RepID=UPI0022472B18|nr:decarboxylating NADP(+)-dependent phosphogluconate dehydrogenase [Aquimarina sp. ERC-38]UZO80191.1 decarboxylating NADP(+)-dependent phosphogluconate dehydrogenase [Aquimarina sp. ERC-38]
MVYIIFGVSGSGKTSIGKKVAERLALPFYDADDFHSKENIYKLKNGISLTDEDRWPWLEKLALEIKKWSQANGAVLACSALKISYRELLASKSVVLPIFILLDGTYVAIKERISQRTGHFFDPALLQSQFDTLELSKDILRVHINSSVEEVVNKVLMKIQTTQSQLGLIGLGVMGSSLAQNMLSKGFSVSVYNRQVAEVEVDVAKLFVESLADQTKVKGFDQLVPFIQSLQKPRSIMLMVNAGKPVDLVIKALLPHLDLGDCIIDGGNSHYQKSIARSQFLKEHQIEFIGAGISGGQEGALKGPSIMPGGSEKAYNVSGKFLEAISAKDRNEKPCCTFVGPEGSGHFIKMVHNGIEYGEMQLIAEIYYLLRFYITLTPPEISEVFSKWASNGKSSFLLDISAKILQKKEGEGYLIDKILDKAGQKGTGGWSTVAALDLGMPVSTISESVMARNLSGMKGERVEAAAAYQLKNSTFQGDRDAFIQDLEEAYHLGSIINHSIGFDLICKASEEYQWQLNLSEIARIWTNGCIIKSELMQEISELFKREEQKTILRFPDIVTRVISTKGSLQKTVSEALSLGCPVPVLSAGLNYLLTYTSALASANMIQAQRDFFGAHTYQRNDQPLEKFFHTDWEE